MATIDEDGDVLEGEHSEFLPQDAGEDIEFEDIDEDLAKYKDDDKIKEALRTGADLNLCSRRMELELRELERASIHDYIRESSNLAKLHGEIKSCDNILESMETMLGRFQGDLGKISGEIKSLQDQSLSMNVKLKNRQGVEDKLASFIDGVAVPPKLIQAICEDEVNEAYLEYLLILRKKFAFTETSIAKDSMATRDIEPELQKLRLRAVDRVREFLLQKIHALGKPKTNFQILQQNVLLKFKYFAQFLRDHAPTTFASVRDTYVEMMAKIYVAWFRIHIRNSPRVTYEIATETDLMVQPEQADKFMKFASGIFGGAAKASAKPREAGFALSDRASVLADIGKPGMLFHVEVEQQRRHPLEAVFRSVNHLLMDTATSEYLFAYDFFGESDTFDAIFKPTLAIVLEQLELDISGCHDAIGLLLMIRVNQEHRRVMEARRVLCLDAYLDSLTMLLWPRFKGVMDTHIESVKQASASSLLTSTSDREPHYVTRRFAELYAAVDVLNSTAQEDTLTRSVSILASEVEKLLKRLADSFSPHRKQLVFLINQYDAIFTICGERGVSTYAKRRYEDLAESSVTAFVDEELGSRFEGIVSLVKKIDDLEGDDSTDADVHAASAAALMQEPKIRPLIESFSAHWKTAIEQINALVMSNFHNMKNGMEILKRVLTQLLLYYTRFLDAIKKYCKGSSTLMKDVVTIPNIMYEIKKYSRTF